MAGVTRYSVIALSRKTVAGYGLPLFCPRCPEVEYFGMLKTPGSKSTPCPNCIQRGIKAEDARLVALRPRRT